MITIVGWFLSWDWTLICVLQIGFIKFLVAAYWIQLLVHSRCSINISRMSMNEWMDEWTKIIQNETMFQGLFYLFYRWLLDTWLVFDLGLHQKNNQILAIKVKKFTLIYSKDLKYTKFVLIANLVSLWIVTIGIYTVHICLLAHLFMYSSIHAHIYSSNCSGIIMKTCECSIQLKLNRCFLQISLYMSLMVNMKIFLYVRLELLDHKRKCQLVFQYVYMSNVCESTLVYHLSDTS